MGIALRDIIMKIQPRIPALISGLLAIKTYPRPLLLQITKGVPTDQCTDHINITC